MLKNKYIKLMQQPLKNGFSLYEMSVVILILALIIAGVMGGQNILHQSRLQRVLIEWNEYLNAVNSFYDEYAQLPGDINNASTFLNTSNNGNGNGIIESSERYFAWEHLSLAERIPGAAYNGTSDEPSLDVITINASWILQSLSTSLYRIGANTTNALILNNGATVNSPAISASDAQIIDNKGDDGLATSGSILSYGVDGSNACVRDNDGTGVIVQGSVNGIGSDYDLSETNPYCVMWFLIR